MPARIADACRRAGHAVPAQPPGDRPLHPGQPRRHLRRQDRRRRSASSGQQIDVIHIVGGGSQNPLLCQLVADAAGRRVVAGPVEATALGNLLVQARTHGALRGDLWGLRAHLRAAVELTSYEPRRAATGHGIR